MKKWEEKENEEKKRNTSRNRNQAATSQPD